jgi:hypothetical protein
MSQQINLLSSERATARSAVVATAVFAISLCALAGYWAWTSVEAGRLREAADLKERDVARNKKALQTLQEQVTTPGQVSPVQAELAALKPKAEALAQLLDELKAGGVGSAEGASRQLLLLASVGEEGLWLTKISVTKAGKSVAIDGRALRSETVSRYAGKLNRVFAPMGVQFNSLEMTPQSPQGAKPGEPLPVSTVDFKLS